MSAISWMAKDPGCRNDLTKMTAFLQDFNTKMLECGLARSADTGQLNVNSISAITVGGSGSNTSYYPPLVYVFTDSLQETSPIFISFKFGIIRQTTNTSLGDANTSYILSISYGSATNGSNSITNPISTASCQQTCVDTTWVNNATHYTFTKISNLKSYINFNASRGYFMILMNPYYTVDAVSNGNGPIIDNIEGNTSRWINDGYGFNNTAFGASASTRAASVFLVVQRSVNSTYTPTSEYVTVITTPGYIPGSLPNTNNNVAWGIQQITLTPSTPPYHFYNYPSFTTYSAPVGLLDGGPQFHRVYTVAPNGRVDIHPNTFVYQTYLYGLISETTLTLDDGEPHNFLIVNTYTISNAPSYLLNSTGSSAQYSIALLFE